MVPTRKSYVSLTSTQKFKLLEDIKNGRKRADAARKNGVERTTILYMLKRSVFLVKPSTISNCFYKTGYEVNTESTIVSEDDEPEVVLPGISS